MVNLGWFDVNNIDFNTLLLLEPLHVHYLSEQEPTQALGTALYRHPIVRWYLELIYAPIADLINQSLTLANPSPSQEEIRQAELEVMEGMQDWLIYLLAPEDYDHLEFLAWDDRSLLQMADFKDKTVLDVGSGTGRLAFTVALLVKVVYAVEPVANLRRYLMKKRDNYRVDNLYPIDGTIEKIPFEDNFSDILMAGHVFGGHPDLEYHEMFRVVRDGGLILLHPGTNANSNNGVHNYLLNQGFEFDHFEEPGGGLKRKYWKTIHK